jgi:hypothetical protein
MLSNVIRREVALPSKTLFLVEAKSAPPAPQRQESVQQLGVSGRGPQLHLGEAPGRKGERQVRIGFLAISRRAKRHAVGRDEIVDSR